MEKKKLPAFKQALLDATLEEFRDIPSEEEIDLEFSEEFEAWAQELLKGPQKRGSRPRGKTLRRLIILAAILAALVTAALATPAIREALIEFFTHNRGTHYEFSFDPEQAATAPRTVETEYCPTYIPEGFVEDAYVVTDTVIMRAWVTDNGEHMLYQQNTIMVEGQLEDWYGGTHVNAENVIVDTVCLNGYEVFRVYQEGYMYYWTDNSYFYQLTLCESFSDEEGFRIFSSILPVEKPNN